MKDLLKYERPRERLMQKGVDALSTVELICILLRSGTKENSVINLSKEILKVLEDKISIGSTLLEELLKIKGIKLAKATTIVAALELSKRINANNSLKVIKDPIDIYKEIKETLCSKEQEHLYCMYLDVKGQIIKTLCLYIGTINQMIVHPREIFKHAVRLSAYAIAMIHNHPSGDSTPSKADLNMTEKVVEVSYLMDIKIIDHIIVGKNEFYSIAERKKYQI